MSDNFKLHISIGNANIELEGDGSLVHTIFTELREHGLGYLSDVEPAQGDLKQGEDKENDGSNCGADNGDTLKQFANGPLPSIREVVMKNLPKKEVEWLLIYAMYCSEQGEKSFTAADLRKMYRESNRLTDARSKNFTTNIKQAVNAGWFSAVNSEDYSLSEIGKSAAFDILKRSVETNQQKSKKGQRTYTKVNYQMVELNLDQNARDELKKYFESFGKTNNIEKALILADWLKNNASIEEVNEHVVYSALRTVGQSTSFDIKAAIANGSNRNSYFVAGEKPGYYKVHHIGEDHIRDLARKKE